MLEYNKKDVGIEAAKPKMHVLQKAKPRKRRIAPFLAVDTENRSNGDFICGHLFGKVELGDDIVEYDESYTERSDLVKDLMVRNSHTRLLPFTLVGFNMGYDRGFIHEAMLPQTVIENSSRFVLARLRNGCQVYDVQTILGTQYGLEKWMDKLHLERKGIKKILTDVSSDDWSVEEAQTRCRYDTMATYELSIEVLNICKKFDIGLKPTAASLAMGCFRTKFLNYAFMRKIPDGGENFFNQYERRAYRGGRCELFARGFHTAHYIDIRSTYASVMANELLPDLIKAYYYENGENWQRYFDMEKEGGIYQVIVRAPHTRIPVLPYMYEFKKGQHRLVFPSGVFRGYYNKPELKAALDNGYEVLECIDFVRYPKMIPLFQEYARFWWNERTKYDDEDPMKDFCKLMSNSLYGGFGKRIPAYSYSGPMYDLLKTFGNPEDDETEKKLFEFLEGKNKVEHDRIAEDGAVIPFIDLSSSEKFDAQTCFPVIPSYICSYARLKLLEGLKRHEKTAIYCDTDSLIYSDEDDLDPGIGDDLGEWKYVEHYDKEHPFFGFSPKTYGSFLQLKEIVTGLTRTKGVPKRAKMVDYEIDPETFIGEITFIYNTPMRYRQAIRRRKRFNEWLETEKTIASDTIKRNFDRLDSMPIEVNDRELHDEPLHYDPEEENETDET